MNRRAFLQTAAAPAILSAAARHDRPNILVIMTDEHNPHVTGCYGNPLARTPNLDRLAAGGITFDAAYCNSPLCVPSRLAFTSGKYIHRVGAWSNACRLPSWDYPSLPRILNAAGYESFLCGKQHYDATHHYGFTEIGGKLNTAVLDGQGSRRRADDTSVRLEAAEARFKDFHAGEDSPILSQGRKVTAGVVDFLSKRTTREKPFFLFAGYLAPHFPLTVPEACWQHFRGRVPMPEIPPGFLETLPLNYQHLRRGFGITQVDPEIVRRGRELYYGLTEWVDREIGTLLGALARSPLADNTVILYTSDHGENMGEHGMWWKNCVYEQAARIPLIVHWPERWRGGQRRAGACSMVDTVRTIAGIAQARVPDDWNGESMLGWLDDARTHWKDFAVSQYYGHNIASGFAMLRSGDWKYVYHSAPDRHHRAERELYQLSRDPGEFHNLARSHGHAERIEALHRALLRELGEHPDQSEDRCRAEQDQGYRTA